MINRLKAWLDAKLVPYWHHWYKLVSMWLATAAAAVASYLANSPDALSHALNALPADVRSTLPVWIGPVVFGSLFFARFWDQARSKHDGE